MAHAVTSVSGTKSYHENIQISRAIIACSVSPSTVEIVDDCPKSEEKWREAAERKNCSAIAYQCDEPQRLVYHCVINTYVNHTLEVCAYSKIIFLGYCTEYSFQGNRIQQSFRANCSQFNENPCPNGYHSTEAYKYPGCYKLTKEMKMKTEQDVSVMSKGYELIPDRFKAPVNSSVNPLTNDDGKDMKRPADEESHDKNVNLTVWLLPSSICILIAVVAALGLGYFMKRKRNQSRREDPEERLQVPLNPRI